MTLWVKPSTSGASQKAKKESKTNKTCTDCRNMDADINCIDTGPWGQSHAKKLLYLKDGDNPIQTIENRGSRI